MMVKQHMLFTLYSICGIVLKGKSASNFKVAYAVLCNLGAHHHYAPRRRKALCSGMMMIYISIISPKGLE